MRSSKLALAVALGASLLATSAAAEPLHVTIPTNLERKDGSLLLELPPSYILAEPEWDDLDFKVRELQKRTAKAEAESKVYRDAEESRFPTWIVVGGGIVTGVLIGWKAHDLMDSIF